MQPTITFCHPTVKTLSQHVQTAFRAGDLPAIKRITALLLLADQHPPTAVAARLGVGRSTVYSWLQAFLVDRWASLRRGKASGRPAKLSPTQKQRLGALVTAGPEAAGYATGCWTSALIQDLIYREFGRMYAGATRLQTQSLSGAAGAYDQHLRAEPASLSRKRTLC